MNNDITHMQCKLYNLTQRKLLMVKINSNITVLKGSRLKRNSLVLRSDNTATGSSNVNLYQVPTGVLAKRFLCMTKSSR